MARHKKKPKEGRLTAAETDRLEKQRRKKVAGFFEDEAELGSDDEENDDVRKKIDKRDAEENEEGLDDDLEEFVVKGGDADIIGDAEEDMLEKFQQDLINDDKARTRQIM